MDFGDSFPLRSSARSRGDFFFLSRSNLLLVNVEFSPEPGFCEVCLRSRTVALEFLWFWFLAC